MPDLPGPLKMKQLIIWAVQRVANSKKQGASKSNKPLVDWSIISESTVQALFANQINTSWYQRPVFNHSCDDLIYTW